MRIKSTILLLGIVLVAATIAWLLSGQPTSDEIARRNQKLLPHLEPDRIQSVTIHTRDAKYVCERSSGQQAGRWMITYPRRMRANGATIRRLLQTFAGAKAQTKSVTGHNPSGSGADAYGLSNNPPRITFATPTSSSSLIVGHMTGVGDMVYVRTGGSNTVTTGPGKLMDALDVRLVDLRARSLISPMDFQRLKSFKLRSPSRAKAPNILCRRRGLRWVMESPVIDSADKEAIKNTVSSLSSRCLKKDDFLATGSDALAAKWLPRFDTPDALLILAGTRTRQKLALARTTIDGEVVWAGRHSGCESVMRVPADISERITDAFQNGGNNFRSPVIANFDTRAAQRILIQHDGSTLALERNEDTWRLPEHDSAADTPTIRNVLKGITTTPVSFGDPTSDSPSELPGEAKWHVRIQNASDQPLARCSFGKSNARGHTNVQRWGYPSVLTVPTKNWVSALKRGRRALQDHRVASISPEQIRRIELTYGKNNFVCERDDADSRWNLIHPVSGPADDPTISSLLESLSPLRTRGYASFSAQNVDRYGLDDPSLQLRITSVPESAETHPRSARPDNDRDDAPTPTDQQTFGLRVGTFHEKYPSGYYATWGKIEGARRVFILPDDIVQQLRSDLASKQIARVKKLRSLTITAGGQSVRLDHNPADNAWRTREGLELKGRTKEKLSRLAQLMKNFRARKVADCVISDAAEYGFDDPVMRIQFSDEFTSGKKLILGKALPDGSRYVRSPATGYAAVISPANAKTLITIQTTLFDKP